MRSYRRVFVKQKVGLKIATRVFAVSTSEGARRAKMQFAQAGELVSRFALRVIFGCRFLRFAFHSRIVFSFPPKNETIEEGFTPALSPSETISSTSLSNSARISATEFNALSPERFVLVE